MAKILKYINRFRDRHGKLRYYCRRPGSKVVPLPGVPGSREFMEVYEAAMSGQAPAAQIGAARTVAGTVHTLVSAYLDCSKDSSSPFKTLAPETQRTRRNILENFRIAHGDKRIFRTEPNGRRVMLLTREHVQRMVNEKVSTPFAQRNFLNTLRSMFDWGHGEGRVPDNPALGVKRGQTKKGAGYKTWSEADIARFEARHAVGTRGRLAFALLLYTGQRRGDVVRMGRSQIQPGTPWNVLVVDQRKTQGNETAHVEIPMHPALQKIIDATPTIGMNTFLVTSFGKPYTAAGFGNWFRELCDEADCPDISAHGLRKACARRLADLGCSTHEIAAVTGHASLAEVARYTAAADRKRLAASAMRKLVESVS